MREGIERLKAIINEEERLIGKDISEIAGLFWEVHRLSLKTSHFIYTTKKHMPKLEALIN